VGEALERNLYRSFRSEPVGEYDFNGLWPSGKNGAHCRAIDDILPFLSDADRKILKDQQAVADSGDNNAVDRSFQHGMAWPGVSPEEARAKANQFVRRELLAARVRQQQGDRGEALRHLGNAMHALQDATSPSHRGFQTWSGAGLGPKGLRHFSAENFYPGPDSDLGRATKRAYDCFMGSDRLPDDFFK
jgi:hypothetical protein